MLTVLSRTWHLYVAMLLILTGLGFQNTILPIAGKSNGVENDMMGYVMSAYFTGFFAGVYLVPILLKKVGFVRVFATLATLAGSTVMLYGVVDSVIVWILIRAITGMCFAGLYLVTETWINDSVDNSNRGNALSMYLVASYVGLMLGQYMVGYSEVGSLVPFVILSLVLSLAFVPVLLSVNAEPKIETSETMSFIAVYKASPMGLMGMLFVGMGNAVSSSIAGIYIASQGATPVEISNFLIAGSVGLVAALYPAGKLSDAIDRRLVIVGLCATSLLGVAIISMQNTIGWMLIIGFILVNMGLGPLYSVCCAQTNDWLEPEQRMSAASRLGFMYGVGSVSGSMIISFLLGVIGTSVFIYGLGVIFGGMMIFAVSRFFIREAQVDEEQASFVPYPSRSTNIAMDVFDDEVFDSSFDEEDTAENKD